MGMAIGWPNVNNQASPSNYVYFIVNNFCIGGEFSPGTTQALLAGVYSPGDYVYSTTIESRVLLGEIVSEPGALTYEVEGLAEINCGE